MCLPVSVCVLVKLYTVIPFTEIWQKKIARNCQTATNDGGSKDELRTLN